MIPHLLPDKRNRMIFEKQDDGNCDDLWHIIFSSYDYIALKMIPHLLPDEHNRMLFEKQDDENCDDL